MENELKRILYVEDEPDIQEVAKVALEAVGNFELIICNNGQEVVDNAPSANADLILMDVMMPGMDGPTALKKLRESPETANTPVIFMTARIQAQEIQEYKEMGAVDVITKPFDPMNLSDQIRTIWQSYHDKQ
jgi:CheY-like chemotaxis protein